MICPISSSSHDFLSNTQLSQTAESRKEKMKKKKQQIIRKERARKMKK